MSDQLIKLTGLWKNSKNGKTWLSGSIGWSGKFLVFPNEFKQKDTDPDYILYVGAKQKQEEQEASEDPF